MRKRIISLLLVFLSIFLFSCSFNNFEKRNSKKISCYNIEMTLNEDNTVLAKQSVQYINNTGSALDKIYFHLYPEAFKKDVVNKPVSTLTSAKAYPNGESYGGIEILSLECNNTIIESEFTGSDKDILIVNTDKTLLPKGIALLEMEYKLVLPNINHRFGYGENAINLGNFYPVACVYENNAFSTNPYSANGDPFYTELSNYNVSINYPIKYTLASSGNIVEETTSETTKSTKLNALAIRDFAIVLSDKFQKISDTINNTTVNYYYYNDSTPEKSLKAGIDSIRTFSNLFGEYPYKQFSVVQTNFVHGGMEYPNLVMISDAVDNYNDYLNVIVHETAHQWWYGLVGSDQFSYGWLDEGLTEYSTALFYKYNNYEYTYDEIVQNAQKSYNLFIEVYTEVFGKIDTSMNRKLNEYSTEPEYVYIAYVKGMLLFDDLSNLIGENRLIKSLSHYCNNYKGKNVCPEQLINSISKTSKRKVESLINSYIEGKMINIVIDND